MKAMTTAIGTTQDDLNAQNANKENANTTTAKSIWCSRIQNEFDENMLDHSSAITRATNGKQD
jgi:hypothetical protein